MPWPNKWPRRRRSSSNSPGSDALEPAGSNTRAVSGIYEALPPEKGRIWAPFLLVGGGVRGVRGEVIWLVMVLGPPWGLTPLRQPVDFERHCQLRGETYENCQLRGETYERRDSSDLPQ